MNPFQESGISAEKSFHNWRRLFPAAYDKNTASPYTKTRIILANGTEFEANWFSHRFARHTDNADLKRALALSREIEKEQQIKISLLKPKNENVLEHTIAYEQLAVDLTAFLAKRETDTHVRQALDFALLEDFDHLYRYANLLEMTDGVLAEHLVGGYTEIMPGRPTVAHHRHPTDNVRLPINAKTAKTHTVLDQMIITAAEQQTMNYYMNVATFGGDDPARRLYQEIALVEEEHVTHYESLGDPHTTWAECWLWHEYCECYVYWSNYMTETDAAMKALWEEQLHYEIGHLHTAAAWLQKLEGKEVTEVIPDPVFPKPVALGENVEYVRRILADTVQFTTDKENYVKVDDLPADAAFFSYQQCKNNDMEEVPSHRIIQSHITAFGQDYRAVKKPAPVKALSDVRHDNTDVGRVKNAATSAAMPV